jgi:hypothetical protein
MFKMGILNSIGGLLGGGSKKASQVSNPSFNNNLNQRENERLMSNNTFARDPNYIVPVDEDENGVADVLETKHKNQYGDGNKKLGKLEPFSMKQPRKDYNQSFDNKGRYINTATYPLPPISHDKKMFARNKQINNKDNKFF